MSDAPLVLVVDDEPDLVAALDYALGRDGFTTRTAANGQEALERAMKLPHPDVVLLDLMLPDMSGTEVLRRLRADNDTASIPVMMVTARGDEVDRIVGFELGADDYITKPFSTRELILRVHAVLRRGVPSLATVEEVDFGVLRIDLPAHRVWIEGVEVTLTALELRLLMALYNRRGRVQSRAQLLTEAWEDGIHVTERTVDTHVKRLRKKILVASQYIETIRGVGYRFVPEAPA